MESKSNFVEIRPKDNEFIVMALYRSFILSNFFIFMRFAVAHMTHTLKYINSVLSVSSSSITIGLIWKCLENPNQFWDVFISLSRLQRNIRYTLHILHRKIRNTKSPYSFFSFDYIIFSYNFFSSLRSVIFCWVQTVCFFMLGETSSVMHTICIFVVVLVELLACGQQQRLAKKIIIIIINE